MVVRVLAVLLAIVMAVGASAPAAMASTDAVSQADDGMPDPDPALAVSPIELAPPARGELRPIVAPRPVALQGRLYRAWVFRPPR